MMHTIYHFKAQEVKNPMLQTVCNSELKWRSYSHWKPITPSWRKNFAKCCGISLLLREFRSLFVQCCGFPPEDARHIPREGSWEPQGGSQLRSPAKSRRHHFLMRNGSWSTPIFATDIGRYFTSDFCYLNPKILLVNHQLQDSLAFKLVKRLNIYVIISFILCSYIYISREPVLREECLL